MMRTAVRTLLALAVMGPAAGFQLMPSFSARTQDPAAAGKCWRSKMQTRMMAQAVESPIKQMSKSVQQIGSLSAEDAVVAAIKDGVANVSAAEGFGKLSTGWSAVGGFGSATGGLLGEWLTPQRLDECFSFWGDGSKLCAYDLTKGRLRTVADVQAFLWFFAYAWNTFPVTPLLIPLVDRALEDKAPVMPAAFTERRLAALRRLQQQGGGEEARWTEGASEFETPQNMEEGAKFLKDGVRLTLRNVRRGRLLASEDDKAVAYARFVALTMTSFPLTPLLLPLVDKWRGDRLGVKRGDYVPAVFSKRKLTALRRLERNRGGGDGSYEGAVRTLRASAAAAQRQRPPTKALLDAILVAQRLAEREGAPRETFLEQLAGGGSPGRRWKLLYIAGKDAVVAARKGGVQGPSRWVPGSSGLYVDGIAAAVQRFDLETMENENGIFELFGSDQVRFTVKGPFKWPDASKRTVCAFLPNSSTVRLFGFEREFAMESEAAAEFDSTPPTKLPFFKFIHVDDKVAVAQGRSGGVAVWARVE